MQHQPTERLTVSRWFVHAFLPSDFVALANTRHASKAFPLTTIQSF